MSQIIEQYLKVKNITTKSFLRKQLFYTKKNTAVSKCAVKRLELCEPATIFFPPGISNSYKQKGRLDPNKLVTSICAIVKEYNSKVTTNHAEEPQLAY